MTTATIEVPAAPPAPATAPAGKGRGPHWYRQYVGECPVCGRDASFRVRVDGPRPADPADRYVQLSCRETYCGCMEWR